MNDRRQKDIWSSTRYFDKDYFCGEINEVADKIRNIPKTLEEDYAVDLTPIEGFDINIAYDYDNNVDVDVIAWRWETDAEVEDRVRITQAAEEALRLAEEKRKKRVEMEERNLYQELKKKYDK